MGYGLVKDTTLQGIANGLRDTGIIPETREKILNSVHYASEYVTSETDPTPTKQPSTSGEAFEVSLPEASYLKFVFNIGKVVSNHDTLRLGTITFSKSGMTSETITIYPTTEDILTYYLDPNFGGEVTVTLNNGGHGSTHTFATIFDVYAAEQAVNTITPETMAEAITNFDMPIAPPEEAFTLTGTCNYTFAEGSWDWFIDLYGDKIKTADIANLLNTFQRSKLERIPFTINIKNCGNVGPFNGMSNLVETPKIRGTISSTGDLSAVIEQCQRLRDIEDLFEPEMLDFFREHKCTSAYSGPKAPRVTQCMSLRRLPSWWNKFRINPESTAFYAYSYCGYVYNFSNCATLDEARDLPVWVCNTTAAQTSNMFSSCFNNAHRMKSLTFELVNGLPVVTRWKAQVIDLTTAFGYSTTNNNIINYNSGITVDKQVTNDETYQALKNDPDWFTCNLSYSRYNHDSAVETINSLPDTSAYLASAGGTNTIKFKKASGSLTDGGAIENLTAEEIAVAAAKGWTVTLS